jgi:hypothetical protein
LDSAKKFRAQHFAGHYCRGHCAGWAQLTPFFAMRILVAMRACYALLLQALRDGVWVAQNSGTPPEHGGLYFPPGLQREFKARPRES